MTEGENMVSEVKEKKRLGKKKQRAEISEEKP